MMEQKIRVMKGKKKLVGRKKRLEDDLTWERRTQWKSAAKRKGRKVRIGYRKAWIDGKL